MAAVRAEHRSAGADPDWARRFRDALAQTTWSDGLASVVERLSSGGRLRPRRRSSPLHHPDLAELGAWLTWPKRPALETGPSSTTTSTSIPPTCVPACRFCAFRRSKRQDDAYAFSTEAYVEDLGRYADHVTEVHSVGGLHPDWDVTTYEAMFSAAKAAYPHVSIKALTAVEVKHLASNRTSRSRTRSAPVRCRFGQLPAAELKSSTMRSERSFATAKKAVRSTLTSTPRCTNSAMSATARCCSERSRASSNVWSTCFAFGRGRPNRRLPVLRALPLPA